MSRTRWISALAAGLAILVAAPEVVNDAPGVTVDLGGAGVMHRTGVAYPEAARKQGVQGTVVVEVKLDANGNVSDAHVVSGPDELRNAALESVLQWHLMKNLAGSTRQVSISFSLPQGPAGVGGGVYRVGGGTTAVVLAPDGRRLTAQPWVGRTLKAINVSGLSDQARADLISQLPVHEGDTLSLESFQNVMRVARAFDEHLSADVAMPVGSSEATLEIMIRGGSMPAASADVNPAPPARIRVGANVQQSKLIFQPRPVYPPEAKQARIQGAVHLNALITKDGTIQNLEVISGEPVLVQAALDAVKQWVYQPTLLNGQAVEVQTEITVNYTLSQ
jgi:TonB family protein